MPIRRAIPTLVAGLLFAAAFAPRMLSADAPLTIGIIWSYSNPSAAVAAFDQGVQTFLKMRGSRVAGRSVQIIKRDDCTGGICPEVARRLAEELLVQNSVDTVGGFVATPNAAAASTATLSAQRPMFVANAPGIGIIGRSANLTRYSFTDGVLATAMGHYAAAHQAKTAFTVFMNIKSGIDSNEHFAAEFQKGGGKMVGADPIPSATTDFSAYLQRIKDAKPDVVFASLPSVSGAAEFVRAFGQSGLAKSGTTLLTTGDMVDESSLPVLGDAALGVVSAFVYSEAHSSPLNRQFVATFHGLFPAARPDFMAVEGYDMMNAIYLVAQAQHGAFDYTKAMQTLKGLKWESPRGPVELDPDTRDLTQNVYIRKTQRVNGTLQNVEIETIPQVRGPG